ncbi:MAG: TetR/AcrR family transcriptional regulator [Oscillospiraceae bacterium]|nr:TetR/AcrR family transcriptional regulator [Oscillospiraceae bacterium]
MNKSESKYFNTALCMDEALIALLEVKDLEYITVKEICEKAGVNRSTFYLHYETVSDLLNEAMEMIDNRFQSYFEQNANIFIDKINSNDLKNLILISQDYLQPYLQFIFDNQKIYRAVLRNPSNMQSNVRYVNLKKHILEPILKKFGVPDTFRKYYLAYYIEGITAIIKEWLNNGCSDSVETVSAVIEECVRPSNGAEGRLYGE